MPSEFYAIAPTFVVPDVVRTAEHYRDVLGFEVLGYFMDPPVFAIVRRGGAEIHFGRSDAGRVVTNESIRAGLGADAYIFVSDMKALHDEFIASGADILEGPIERPYRRVEIGVIDRDGHKLVFVE